jgi:hypothetical protein
MNELIAVIGLIVSLSSLILIFILYKKTSAINIPDNKGDFDRIDKSP